MSESPYGFIMELLGSSESNETRASKGKQANWRATLGLIPFLQFSSPSAFISLFMFHQEASARFHLWSPKVMSKTKSIPP